MSIADLGRYEMVHAPNLDALCALVQKHQERGIQLLAGGTDLMVEVSQGGPAPEPLPVVVDVSRMDELRGIDYDGHRIRIGAAVTYLELQRHELIQRLTPLIAEMTFDVGGPTIQARGTLGGNLATASPAADGVAAIAPYEPTIEVRSVRGSRRIPMRSFQTGYKTSSRHPDEVIVAVEIVPPPEGSPWVWRKVGTRRAQAISKVALGAIAVVEREPAKDEKDDDKIKVKRFGAALASVAPVTALMAETHAMVLGHNLANLKPEALDAAIDRDIAPIDDLRSTRAYRAHCAKALIRGFLRDLGAPIP
jgi:CO/xanthine dehydrogenase FAD-binding subunit